MAGIRPDGSSKIGTRIGTGLLGQSSIARYQEYRTCRVLWEKPYQQLPAVMCADEFKRLSKPPPSATRPRLLLGSAGTWHISSTEQSRNCHRIGITRRLSHLTLRRS